MDLDQLTRTRRSLHGVAERLLAGPQYRTSGTIRLRVTGAGFATVAAPTVAVDGTDLVVDGRRLPLAGTYRSLAEAAGLDDGPPEGLYDDRSGVDPDERLEVDAGAAATIAEWFARADAALRRLDPDETPVLWPEHFDVGTAVAEVNYGASPGDSWSPEPYAYVGPWTRVEGGGGEDGFWNAPFGAARRMSDLPHADAVLDFFIEGRRRAVGG